MKGNLFPVMSDEQLTKLEELAKLIRYYILVSTTASGSGHPTSCLSATDVMTALMFGGYFKTDLENTQNPNNDRLIFSKGHAAPLLYSMYAAAGKITEEELLKLRQIDSPLEGHPTPLFAYSEAATGSLGQGLGIGVGMALSAKLDNLDYKTYVLLGDGEMAEGSVWEAIQLASFYKLNNLVAILDLNGWGLAGKTMLEDDAEAYLKRAEAFGWEAIVVDGHSLEDICEVFDSIGQISDHPIMIIAKTKKGAGITISEGTNLHGKTLNQEQLIEAIKEIGKIDREVNNEIAKPLSTKPTKTTTLPNVPTKAYQKSEQVATREAYGQALVELAAQNPNIVALDADLSSSTFAGRIKEVDPSRFLEMYIAEQNMVSVGAGMASRGKIPFCSSFAAFLTRSYDQIRMARYSNANIKLVGSHCGVSIGEDGFSQMGLEDIAMFRAILDSVVIYPSDAVSTVKLTKEIAQHKGLAYLRTSRPKTNVIYDNNEEFPIGGSKTLKTSAKDSITIIGAGVTLHEALKAYDILAKENITVRVIDLYSIKPIDEKTLIKANQETKAILVVEDHYQEGGIYGAVCETLMKYCNGTMSPIHSLAVTKMPRSGKPEELLAYEQIDANAIVDKIRNMR